MADNILWKGKVTHQKKDSTTESIHLFNEIVNSDPNFETLILPIRDGLSIIRKLN